MYSTDGSSDGFETGVIYCDDNLERLRQMDAESVDLIYLDPPFFSNRHYEVIWGDEAEVRSFEDRWKGGINAYVDWMKHRMVEMREVLKPTGSIYLHCDWHASHYLKVMMDSVFGMNNFQNEIAWCYNVGGKSTKRWARKHDTILFYSKGSSWHFDGKAVGISRDTGDKSFGGKMGVDGEGRRYQDKLDRKSGKYYRYYLDEPKIPEDWWVINSIQSQSKERLGYPTQKPEALLERIIKASSRQGDVVLDPFCGCGTTIAVAQMMNRRWIGIDISLTAAELMKARVESVGAPPVKIKGDPKNKDDLRKLKPFEFQNYIIRRVVGKHSPRKTGDMGIDGFSYFERLPIQVKRSEKVGRPVVDAFVAAVQRHDADKGYIVALSFTSGAHEEVARLKNAKKKVEIELIEAEDIRTGKSPLVPPRAGRRILEYRREERPTVEVLDESEKKSPPEAPDEAA